MILEHIGVVHVETPEYFNAVLGIIYISIIAAFLGTYVVSRHQVSLAGGVTHASFGGLGLGFFLGMNPLIPAAIFAVASALGVDAMTRDKRVRADSAISVVWALGMTLGVVFVFLTPGYVPELTIFLFGDVMEISDRMVHITNFYTIFLVAFWFGANRELTAISFDPDFCRVKRMRVWLINTAMTIFVAVGIVLVIKLVGVALLMAVLTLPQMVAEKYTRSMNTMAMWSGIICVVCALTALWLSTIVHVPCSALIVGAQVAVFIIAYLVHYISKRMKA